MPKLRRLAADHAALHEALPPNYLFPPEDAQSDDITQLAILLAGPQGTPFSQGLWRLHLKLPEDYPKSPPKATFKTRIWHPNVEESTGAVCVDTLKRDWKSTLTLKDVLIVSRRGLEIRGCFSDYWFFLHRRFPACLYIRTRTQRSTRLLVHCCKKTMMLSRGKQS